LVCRSCVRPEIAGRLWGPNEGPNRPPRALVSAGVSRRQVPGRIEGPIRSPKHQPCWPAPLFSQGLRPPSPSMHSCCSSVKMCRRMSHFVTLSSSARLSSVRHTRHATSCRSDGGQDRQGCQGCQGCQLASGVADSNPLQILGFSFKDAKDAKDANSPSGGLDSPATSFVCRRMSQDVNRGEVSRQKRSRSPWLPWSP